MGKRNKADNRTSSETSTSMTGDNEDDDRDEDNDSDKDEGEDEDEDDSDEDEDDRDEDDHDDSEPKDRCELSGNSVGIAKGGDDGTYSNAATPIAPVANEGDSTNGIDNNNGGPWGVNNTTGTAGGPTTPLATATTTPTPGGIAAALTPTRTTSTPTTTVGGIATTGGDLDMASCHDLQVLPVRWEEFYVVGPVGMFIIWLTISKLKIHSLNPL